MNVDKIKKICILGTGTMGSSITLTFALAGYQVHMYGRSENSLKGGFERIDNMIDGLVQYGLVLEANIPEIMGRIQGVTTLENAAEGADFVIEAISEDITSKQEIFAKMEKLCPIDTVFASSTSGLSPTTIADSLEHKDRFVVAHFWNPPHLIPLVEVVPGRQTSQNTIDCTEKLLTTIGKKPVVLKCEVLGFIGNRLQFAMLREALFLLESGIASKEAIDTTIKYSLGRRLSTTGPLESADLGGLDIIYNISKYLFNDLCNSKEVPAILKDAIDKGKLGAKTGSGFYQWNADSLLNIKKDREEHLMEWLGKDKKV